ncbi:acetamidase [Aureobasidium pullulans]|uniref:amidase n=1 Tax=Aureobasidium pullulans TaxID=5580 RepID=A0A4S9CAZ5_AURPU|nr:acetamidase [Aureobasidium pullulans]
MTRTWQDIAKAKQAALSDSIPPEWRIPTDIMPPDSQLDVTSFPRDSGFFTKDELKYTTAKIPEILQQIHSKAWKAVDVAQAFSKRAAVCHQLTNCLSETLFPEALERAKFLDDHLQKTGNPIGPLHGLPVSLKDNFNIIGKDSTLGFVSWVGVPATYNTVLVDVLLKAGALLYVKTNVPTAMMIAESVNNTFGRTVNPLNRKLTSGGSSGGESALIAFGGSVLGVGTDIGGSLRIPAACTGIFTLRPSFGRFPTANAKSGLAGQEAVNSVNGPMARTLDDIEFFAKNVVNSEPWKLDPKCLPISWRPVDVGRKLRLGVIWNDGIVVPTPPVRRALKHAVEKLQEAGHEIVDWEPELHQEAMDLLHGKFKHVGYTGVFNILDYSAVSFPSGIYADSELDEAETGIKTLSQMDAQIQAECEYFSQAGSEKANAGLDNAGAVHGMPVSLQLVASRLEEEKALAMTRVVLEGLGVAVI